MKKFASTGIYLPLKKCCNAIIAYHTIKKNHVNFFIIKYKIVTNEKIELFINLKALVYQ